MARIKVDLTETSFVHQSAFISLNSGSVSTISNLQSYLRMLFGLNSMELFINGSWLPPEEGIDLIHPGETVTVVEKNKKEKSQNGIVDDVSIEKKTKSRGTTMFAEDKISTSKKTMVSKLETTTPSKEEFCEEERQSTKSEKGSRPIQEQDQSELEGEAMDVTDNSVFFQEPRRKRRRKHKKRKTADKCLINGENEPNCTVSPTVTQTQSGTRVSKDDLQNRSHIRFDEVECHNEGVELQNHTENTVPYWQENLLHLAQQGGKKVFIRTQSRGIEYSECDRNGCSTLTNGTQQTPEAEHTKTNSEVGEEVQPSDLENSSPLETPKPHDLIYFKRLTMIDCTPIVSGNILGLIEDVIDNLVTIKILKGQKEELFLVDEIEDAEGGSFIVKLKWEEVIEPRLVTDRSLLLAYL